MNCAWDAYMKLVPMRLKRFVDEHGRESLQELRLRIGRPPELIVNNKSNRIDGIVTQDDLNFCINVSSKYSPWTSNTIENGFITAQGGHRVGICGEMNIKEGKIQSVKTATSVAIRVARDMPGVSKNAAEVIGSTLIIGSPGTGKTTLMRDIVRRLSDVCGCTVAVVDERRELFPVIDGSFCFFPGSRTDVLSGCKKQTGIELLIRTMTPQTIAVDEITAEEDCTALLYAGWCGVRLLATAHAATREDLFRRKVYAPLLTGGLFDNLIILRPDKSWTLERMKI